MNFRTIHGQHMFRFLAHVSQLRHTGLHAKGHLLLCDRRLNFRISQFLEVLLIESCHQIEHLPPHLTTDPLRIGKEKNGIAFGLQGHALMLGGQEAGTP